MNKEILITDVVSNEWEMFTNTNNLKKLSEASIYEKESLIEEICLTVVNTLNELGLSHSKIDFLTYQAEEVRKHIFNPSLRNEDSWIE